MTNVVDAIGLGRIGTGISCEGWRVTSVTNYGKDYRNALRLNLKTSSVDSPVFTNTIVGIELDIVSSSQSGRRLAITPFHAGKPLTDLTHLCDYSTSKNIFIPQSIRWAYEARIDAIQFNLVGSSTTAWGISRLAVICEERRLPTVIVIR